MVWFVFPQWAAGGDKAEISIEVPKLWQVIDLHLRNGSKHSEDGSQSMISQLKGTSPPDVWRLYDWLLILLDLLDMPWQP